ncbi:C-_U-editing enzyme APOBEC-2-like [Anguilla rostrata]|uniref:CMP/dCMP-type deaminase domain-containing protein n=1 Tax=Anguilla anguilla TaxID=7936 RepID=A0A9D3RPQ6_ANGAN|nr:C->U-editing enzyme APOBEC-2-like [Anguilla anguilla]XP_035237093.1 C->U-editing enzyme APOBEC-2-like [Anguilla anguilla]KAG5837836.1 hypothetical protein ANANG_G00217260 [Anguilla anguilla]
MADNTGGQTAGPVPVQTAEKKVEMKSEKDKKPDQAGAEGAVNGAADGAVNGPADEGAVENGEFLLEPFDLPPLEVIAGVRIDPFSFKFQFRNVEYSSGRGKIFLCYMVDSEGNDSRGLRGCLEAEHLGPHPEEAFFQRVLPEYDPKVKYLVTWYVSSSPCTECAAKLIEILRARPTLRLVIYCSRVFLWEEPEIQQALRALAGAGCKLRMMKPADFLYIWDAYVENEGKALDLWEDCQDNYEYYETRLADILP